MQEVIKVNVLLKQTFISGNTVMREVVSHNANIKLEKL